ncbi:MAG: squalene/phytoene synthase family protein [Rhodospirillaceae bacterium]|jgi:phytoene synthase|nr:squalene/phytoene synthase family protein [Rhodospirillaceae bacterium]MBT7485265.1 squalene/phytoene synthase family protein [Rhodospirillales bacterium]MBT4703834.1 squalene/phytoene synthase family protein [Rhodospirillaceae bacterium]MBT5036019.1 squalene/phytoene synthase family protein [Rhodospirillaceae bacterium]MBT6220597.1 squalene/phytoene synthase family protein [Rhodospirillaceae bacterium]
MTEYAYCQNLVERFDPDRYLCSLFAGSEIRADLMALYAFNVEVAGIRESVSEPLIGQMRLQWWRDSMDRIFGGAPPAHQVATALSQTINKFDLERSAFDVLLDARTADFDDAPFATLLELESYVENTSATLTRLTLQILGQSESRILEVGRHVGIAWALTGLLRAIPFHARQGRSCLPVELVKGSAYKGPEISEVVAVIGAQASEHLRKAREGQKAVPRTAVAALLSATLADGYLDELKNANFDPFKGDLRAARVSTKIRLLFNVLRGRY